jgi:hypothetical protein
VRASVSCKLNICISLKKYTSQNLGYLGRGELWSLGIHPLQLLQRVFGVRDDDIKNENEIQSSRNASLLTIKDHVLLDADGNELSETLGVDVRPIVPQNAIMSMIDQNPERCDEPTDPHKQNSN